MGAGSREKEDQQLQYLPDPEEHDERRQPLAGIRVADGAERQGEARRGAGLAGRAGDLVREPAARANRAWGPKSLWLLLQPQARREGRQWVEAGRPG